MNPMFRSICYSIFLWATALSVQAQSPAPRQRIAVFAPLYLDSAFDATGTYRYEKNTFPRFITTGLEFYEGVQLALDSLNREKIPLEVHVYDTRSSDPSLTRILQRPELDSVSLMIAHCNTAEVKLLAEAAQQRHIPLINANLPNDGGITGNPFLLVLNPTLRTQCEGLIRYVLKQHGSDPVIVFRKKGVMEDRIRGYFEDQLRNQSQAAFKLRYVDLPDSFSVQHLRPLLDTLKNTVCIAASLDENFGRRFLLQLAQLRKQQYKATAIGMPTWDNIREFRQAEYKGIEYVYSDPFYNPRTDATSQGILTYFKDSMYARPGDMVFRGYEVTWKFVKLLLQHSADLASNLGSRQHRVFTDFDIQPVLNRQTLTLDYFENKKLYFLKWQDGILKGVY
ncbi:MAG: hypothetical protein RJA57_811 [Bacteroidota bacterium]|jgi:ABC-type branched-subunit amino acid transport system substrate-binding protein